MGIVKLSKTGFTGATYQKSDSFLIGNAAYVPMAKGLFGGGTVGGSTYVSTIDYININSTGDAVAFGNLTVARGDGIASCSSTTRGVWANGWTGSNSTVIDYVTIATAGNATNFGNLTIAKTYLAACSDSHGGL